MLLHIMKKLLNFLSVTGLILLIIGAALAPLSVKYSFPVYFLEIGGSIVILYGFIALLTQKK